MKRFRWILLVLTLALLVPIWAYHDLPTTDGPSHLENAYILLHFHESGGEGFDQFYDLEPHLVPNWLGHVALPPLLLAFDPWTAEKVFLSLYVLFFVFAVRYFLRSVDPASEMYTVLALPLALHFPLFMGFYNFTWSVPVMLLAVGFWWRRQDRLLDWRTLVSLNLILIALFFCHLVSQVAALACVIGLVVLLHGRHPQRVILFVAGLAPALFLPVRYFLIDGVGSWIGGISAKFADFFGLHSLVSFDSRTTLLGIALAGLLGVLAVLTAWAKATGRVRRLEPRDAFLAGSMAFSVLYFVLPDHFVEGGFIRDRLGLFPFLLVLAWFTPRLGKHGRRAVVVLAALITLAHAGLTTWAMAPYRQQLADYTSGIPRVRQNDTILPLSFDHMAHPGTRISAYLHAAGHYVLATGCINLDNFEGRYDSSPLNYKPDRNPFQLCGYIESGSGELTLDHYPVPIDFILLWSPRPTFPCLDWIREHYVLVHAQGRMQLYERRDRVEPGS
jgi:hypothetical protein